MSNTNSALVMYQTDDGQTKINVIMEDETVWLAQAHMVELFQSSKSNVSEHIRHIFEEGELNESSVVRKFRTTAADGKSYYVNYYNLDVIISVGYRVKSLRGTQFRRWALNILREYLVKGFSMNDDVLKNAGGGNYWHELLQRIRDIRSSEKLMYRQVLDLYATSVDYDPRTPESRRFFQIVQNKIHYAAHGHTAPEIIAARANANLPNMGVSVTKGEVLVKIDITVAKNYLSREELEILNRLVSAFFDLAEIRAMQHIPMYMKDWVKELDDFALRYGKGVLENAGKVSTEDALAKAEAEYEKYKKRIINTPSPAERDYLASIKNVEKKLTKKHREGNPNE